VPDHLPHEHFEFCRIDVHGSLHFLAERIFAAMTARTTTTTPNAAAPTTALAGLILAIDLGKYKSVGERRPAAGLVTLRAGPGNPGRMLVQVPPVRHQRTAERVTP
jgi:hypothetical protein